MAHHHQAHHGKAAFEARGVKKLVTESTAPKRISHIQFGLLAGDEVQKMSEFQLSSTLLFSKQGREPAPGGAMDMRLGVSDKRSICETCKMTQVDCAGHFGFIKLELPCFHIGYFKHTLTILQCICKTCGNVLLDQKTKLDMLRKIRSPRLDALGRAAVFKKVVTKCKKAVKCTNPACGAYNGTVKKVIGAASLKLIHEKYKGRHADGTMEEFRADMHHALANVRDVAANISKCAEDLPALTVLDLFKRITDEDCELLWMTAGVGRPENLIVQNLLVPPVPIRPSVPMDSGGGSTEDDLTTKLHDIIGINECLRVELAQGATIPLIMEHYDILQLQVSMYINGDIPGMPKPPNYNKAIRGLCQRLKGKAGRFRGNLSGKRVDFSARTVISPDPNLRVDQVGVPEHVAKTMTYPERVTAHNELKLKQLIMNGKDRHPGANTVRPAGDGGLPKTILPTNRTKLCNELRIGDIVERHMEDGDVVLFNRQPSLHRMSIMAHRAKIMPWRTFRFNECVCNPYNADFDGDEMNMHLPQTEEARAEAATLMAVVNNLVTPKNGEPLVAATQDFLTASYLITQNEIFFDKEEFCEIATYMGDAGERIDMPIPAIVAPVALWTGKQAKCCDVCKQVMSLLVRPQRDSPVLVNFETKEKNYTTGLNFCEKDGYVHFRNSEMLSGTMAKRTLGDGSKSGLFYTLIREHGPHEAARCMNRLAKLCARYLGGHRGFSIGIDDVTPSPALVKLKADLLRKGYTEADIQIKEYRKGQLELKAGCNAEQSLESSLNGVLGELRRTAGDMAMKELPWVNSPRIMAECGSKGSPLNISQMIACVGQQSVGGKRIENGFVKRTLPHFVTSSLYPAAKGFVANSFYSGLTATEFFFHTMGGREGLVDTAVKTAETGYMARRLMKALEDLSMQYDATVRNSEGAVVQFVYGDDGLSPQCMECTVKLKLSKWDEAVDVGRPVEFGKLLTHVKAIEPCPSERALEPAEIKKRAAAAIHRPAFQQILPTGSRLHEEVKAFFQGVADDSAASDGAKAEAEVLLRNTARLTSSQMESMLSHALDKYCMARVEPGEAVGAIGAQSISEPGTQMTLKTFHFAGVASMNVTLGVPRLKEIINASKAISTPIITAKLVKDNSKVSARMVKAKVEKTMLGEVAEYIKEVYANDRSYIAIKLDLGAIRKLHLEIDSSSVRQCILKGYFGENRPAVLRLLAESHVQLKHGQPDKALKKVLPSVIVQGIPSISRAVICCEEDRSAGEKYHLLVEGYGLAAVMGAAGIEGTRTKSNHIIEMEKTLGIEAARRTITEEISYIMSAYGISVDRRHLLLLSDVMSFKGEVLGITRFGVSKMRESVLMLASFEKTTDHLFDAAVHARRDAIVGVSECIIMGIPIPLGTGLFKLLRADPDPPELPKPSCCWLQAYSDLNRVQHTCAVQCTRQGLQKVLAIHLLAPKKVRYKPSKCEGDADTSERLPGFRRCIAEQQTNP
ncbi:RNA polymerase III, largest subunit [Tribonema minus]|uniref:DNA-directed RNA polymerase subunit n=1 Tax=Tribonema minus TaxID=303371 RepID=A0A836CEF0_9STRA|nr:RNA polymerase III, largest subunit [Tribonema minus]